MVKTYIFDLKKLADKSVFKSCLADMSEYRRRRVTACKNEAYALEILGAGVALNYALLGFGLRERDIRFSFNEHGKPSILGCDNIFFSLSHSGDFALCSVSDFTVGADIEKIRNFSPAILSKVCTKNEKLYLLSLNENERKSEFFRLWTARESYAKFIGCGVLAAEVLLDFDFNTPPSFCGLNPPFLREYARDGYKITVCGEKELFCDSLITVEI